jgi:hypothetical protein
MDWREYMEHLFSPFRFDKSDGMNLCYNSTNLGCGEAFDLDDTITSVYKGIDLDYTRP